MKVLVVGGGGRENALVWKIAQSPRVDSIICAPGNGRTQFLDKTINEPKLDIKDPKKIARYAKRASIDLTVIGPEALLVEGIVDVFEERGLTIFGPTRDAAKLEGSKVEAKGLMKDYNIPTARFDIANNEEEAREIYKREFKGKDVVVKVDGLAAGKGALVCMNEGGFNQAMFEIFSKKRFGKAADRLVLEERLEGEEVSYIVISDGKHFVPLLPSQDHKPIFENPGDRNRWIVSGGDKRYKGAKVGPNTGGMGAYAPAPIITPEIEKTIKDQIIAPTISGMKKQGTPYKGVLYVGLMITKDGPRVLEYNCRFGDPETQPVMMLLKRDLVTVMTETIAGNLEGYDERLDWKDGVAVGVVLASGGYPGDYKKGMVIEGLDNAYGDTEIFHAGTRWENGRYQTSGGRVVCVTAVDEDLEKAVNRAYRAVPHITFDDVYYRTDIGQKGLATLKRLEKEGGGIIIEKAR